jgi:phage terminase large subunit GpA-like protein
MNLLDGWSAVMEAVARAWELPEKLTVSQWADRHRKLSSKSSAEPGDWRTDRNPLLREPMDALSDHHPCSQVTAMFCSQFGKSEILNNWVGYTIDHSPAPMLLIQPTVEVMERYSKQRIEPMIAASERLREKVPSARKRDSGNSLLLKEFPGGMVIMGGANSSASIASMPIKKLGMDEVDKYPGALGAEGSTLKQAEQRQVTFARSKQLNTSTPIRLPVDDDDLGGSAIYRKYQASSRGAYHVPCPHCGHLQELLFEHLRWEKETDQRGVRVHRPETAVYMCQGPDCGLAIEESAKHEMLRDQAMGGQARWVHERPWITDHLGYRANALYTPIGLGRSWAEIAEEWLEACRDRSKLVTFWNLVLGLPFDDHADRMSEQDLEAAAEDYPLRVVPRGYYVLTASVDTQPDRLEFLVRAWGPGERSVVIDDVKLYGDPEKPEVWAELTKARRQTFANAHGMSLRISMTAIDTGGSNTAAVYRYCREHRHDCVMAVKGSSQRKAPVLNKPRKQDLKNNRGEYAKHGVMLWMVGTDTAKEVLFARLSAWAETPVEQAEQRLVRLTKRLGNDFFRELTAEVFDAASGLWKKLRARNEALDKMVYSHAAAYHPSVRIDKLSPADWELYRRAFEPDTADLFTSAGNPESLTAATAANATAEPSLGHTSDPQAPVVAPGEGTVPPSAVQPQPEATASGGWLDTHTDTDNWLD